MASSTPSRSIDSEPSEPKNQRRSLSLSASSRTSLSSVRERSTQRSQTQKAKRKNVSNRSTPYTSPQLPRANQSNETTTSTSTNDIRFDDGYDLTRIDVNVDHDSSEENNVLQEQDPFEKSSDDEKENREKKNDESQATSPSKVLEYFTKGDKKNKYFCKKCKQEKTTNGSSVFNLRRHLALQHDITLGLDVSAYRKKNNQCQEIPVIDTRRRIEIDKLLLNCIIHGGLPFNHFNHPWYHSFFTNIIPGYTVPDRRTFRKRVKIQYDTYINELKKLIPKDRPIAFTTDIWKSSTRNHYICLTIHFFNNELEPFSLLLSFRRLTGRKLSKNLNDYLRYELYRFGLESISYAGITTDNGSDIKAATEKGPFGPRCSCIAHTLNLIVNHGMCIWKKPNDKRYPFKPYDKNILIDDDDEEDEYIVVDDDVEEEVIDAEETYKQEQNNNNNNNTSSNSNINEETSEINDLATSFDNTTVSSVPSTTVPVDDEYISDDDEDMNNSSTELSTLNNNELETLFHFLCKTCKLIGQVRKLAQTMKNVTAIDQFIRNNPNGPKNGFVTDMRIRWSSCFYMLKRLIDYQLIVKTVLIYKFPTITTDQQTTLTKCYLNPESWEIIQAVHDILKPLEFATSSLSGKHYPTLSLAYTTINILRSGLKPRREDSKYLVLLKKSILAQFEYYFDFKMSKIQKELMLIASFLDPETFTDMSVEDKQKAKAILPTYMKKESQFIVESTTSTPSAINKSSQSLTEKLKMMVGISTTVRTTRPPSIDDEIVLFIQAIQAFSGSFSTFWLQYRGRFTRLYRVALRVNIIPATSVPSETIFSIAGFISRKQRSSLSSTSLRHLMVLKESHKLEQLRAISRNSTH
ncbi:unnamed protein product [Adineta steineri]|uniref:HAT C-terminal dimerisation domain-containing protein n=1 Tax=Adineta steineri TaxID=433720 RepID=A0A819LIV8_9BILA|nr:unnamed protein product [Adineta steineri]CAF3965866.1 unnamed protein product [Adineta steineri]